MSLRSESLNSESSTSDETTPIRQVQLTRSRPPARKCPAEFSPEDLDKSVHRTLKAGYARSTWRRREMIRRWWVLFTSKFPDPTALRFFAWLKSNGILLSTLHTYATTFLAMHPTLKTAETALYLRALGRSGAFRPTRQAKPLTVQEASTLFERLSRASKWGLFLAWKTASRWSDVARLRKQDVIVLNNNELVITFPLTKSTALRPFRPDLYVHVVHRTGMAPFISYLRSLRNNSPITSTSGKVLLHQMRTILGDPTVGTHSLKRGAVQLLMKEAARGKLSPETVGRLAKHATTSQRLQDQTVRYVGDPVSLAVTLGTGAATALIPLQL